MRELKIQERITERGKTIEAYFKEINRIPIFTDAMEEYDCAVKAFDGDKKAREELIIRNLRFVVSVAKQYSGTKVSLSDLITEGNIGLLEATEKFDPSKGFKFISYAVWYIRKRINRYLSDHARLVRIPNNKVNNLRALKARINQMEQENDGVVYIDELMEEFKNKLSDGEFATLMNLESGSVKSLDAPFGDVNDGTLLDVMWDDELIAPTDDLLLKNESREIVDKMLDVLPEKQRSTLIFHFGLHGEPKLSLADIGIKLNISREGARQLKMKAERSLRREFPSFIIS